MTDPETPVDVLAAALLEVDSVGGPGLWGDEDTAIAILAAMPDHTIVSKTDLAALRAVAEAGLAVTTTHLWTEEERRERRSAWAELVDALARLESLK